MENEKAESANFIHSLPKVELHRHLVGSIRVETFVDIAIKNDIPLPTNNLEKLKSLIVIKEPASNLRQFLKLFNIIKRAFFL